MFYTFCRHEVGHKPGLGPGANDFLTETWFMALLGSMVTVMLLLFTAMILVRRRQLLSKKSSLSGESMFPYSFASVTVYFLPESGA